MRLVRLVTTALLLVVAFALVVHPELALSVFPRGWSRTSAASVVIAVAMCLVAVTWPCTDERDDRGRWPRIAFGVTLVVTILGAAFVFSAWVDRLLLFAIDPTKGDMLVEINAAIDHLSTGQDPYAVYHVPWDLPLTYGPWLWGWFLIPRALGADPRMMTAFGQLFVSVLAGLGAAFAARSGGYARAAILLVLAWTLVGSPLFDDFLVVGHTPAYWPLMATFALLCSAGADMTAAAILGLLLAARTPMIAVVPVFAIHVWHTNRARFAFAIALITAAAGLSFLPFVLWDWRMLVYGMYGYYVTSIKNYVWTQTPWMDSTLGLTRVLLASGHASWIGASQVLALAFVYALAWRALRAGARVGPWFCIALLAFSMTTLWPVWYIFLDVFVLAVAFLASDVTPVFRRVPWRTTIAVTVTVALVMTATLLWNPGVFYTLEPGRTPRWHFRSGFGPDETDASHAFVWTTRATVHMRLPRGLRTDAVIQIDCDPTSSDATTPQSITAALNGVPIGQVMLQPGWQVASFQAPRRDWQIGHNDLTLSFAHVEPTATGEERGVRIASVKVAR